MENLVFIKLGGSLITDKQRRYHLRAATVQRLAQEIARARAADPTLRIVLGHGSGSFGHVAAQESGYSRRGGHPSPLALAQVGAAASQLNHLVRAALLEAGVPALSLPPSASARLNGERQVVAMATEPFRDALRLGLLPLTFGDVALHSDGQGSGIASTEAVFRFLAQHLAPQRLLLLGQVEGVYERPPMDAAAPAPLLREITPHTWGSIRGGLGGSHGTDVTGGMGDKVAEMLALVQALPTLRVRVVSGEQAGLLERLLLDPALAAGTLIHTGHP